MDLKGSCNCGEVKYLVKDAFEFVGNCHCSQCRKFSGSAFSTFGRLSEDDFRIVHGESALARFIVSENTTRVFCTICGSSLYALKPEIKKIHLRMGTLDDMPSSLPTFHVHTASKAPWHEITDDLNQYKTVPDA